MRTRWFSSAASATAVTIVLLLLGAHAQTSQYGTDDDYGYGASLTPERHERRARRRDQRTAEGVWALFRGLVRRNQAPDFVLDRGHEFGAELGDEDRRALIEFLKTF